MSTSNEFPLSEEYKKDTGITPEDVRMFREWLETQPHLPNEHITDLDLILAYHACEKSLAVAKEVLDLHFTLKTHLDYFFANRRFDDRIERLVNYVCAGRLQGLSKEGYVCFFGRITSPDLSLYNFSEGVRGLFMALDLYQYEEGTWPGVIFIIDMAGSTFGHVLKTNIQHLQQYLYFLQEATLIKLTQIHFINAASFIDKLFLIVKPFLSKSMWEKIHVHQTGTTSLNQFYDMDYLPIESGGKYKTLDQHKEITLSKLKCNDDYFARESLKRVTESRRPGKPKSLTDFCGGVEGSFKKLDID